MEDTVLCPICETENAADATHCEVCGERLKPAEPGEEVGPEESVAESLSSDGGSVVGFAVEGDDETAAPADETADFTPVAFEDDYYEFEPSEEMGSEADDDELDAADTGEQDADFAHDAATAADVQALEEELQAAADSEADDDEQGDYDEAADEYDEVADEYDEAADEDAAADEYDEAVDEDAAADDYDEYDEAADEYDEAPDEYDEAPEDEQGDYDEAEAPDILYSPLDGTAYHAGSPEYEEGFGPMGEELVAEPPELDDDAPDAPSEAPPADETGEMAGFEDEYDEQPARREPSAEFRAAFQAREKERPAMEPLPQPGTYAQPATLTVYVNREPVLRHDIETDETLIGRKDPVSDAYPDLDLTDYDPDSFVSRKHAYIYRQNKNYTLYAVSNAGTQLNDELLDLGDRRALSEGDVIILAGKIAMKFELPDE